MPDRDNAIEAATRRLQSAWEHGSPCAPVRDLLGDSDIEAAYRVQQALVAGWEAEGRRVIGRKIGLTNRAIQAQLGIDQPDYGMLFADMAVPDGASLPIHAVCQGKIEAEIAFVLGRDLPHPDSTFADVAAAIDCAVAALEIPASRIADWDIRITDTIADNASCGRFVLGGTPKRLAAFDPVLCGMVLYSDAVPASIGAGAACLGNPLAAVTWLAQVMAHAGRPLRAGDMVLSGALGPMLPLAAGTSYRADIQGLGSVSVHIGL